VPQIAVSKGIKTRVELLAFANSQQTLGKVSLLTKGRGKYRNILIKGPANCGKTFLLNPLNSIYRTFTNPAVTNFAWVCAEKCEVIFLNDFRWSEKVIPWHDLLLLLQGQTVHLPAPKSHFAQDIEFVHEVPIFCTGKEELVYVRGRILDVRESEMMRVRWIIFTPRSLVRSKWICYHVLAVLWN
jgi:hypothetical protein